MNQEQRNNNEQNNFQPSNQSGGSRNGITSFKVGGIFSLFGVIGLTMFIITTMAIGAAAVSADNKGLPRPKVSGILLLLTIISFMLLPVGGLGAFICAIVGLVNSTSNYPTHPSKGVMIAAGIVGILCIPIANTILFFMAYGASKR